jgi:hypothetical protein
MAVLFGGRLVHHAEILDFKGKWRHSLPLRST